MNRGDRVKLGEDYIRTFTPENRNREGTVIEVYPHPCQSKKKDYEGMMFAVVKWEDSERPENIGEWLLEVIERFEPKQKFSSEIG